MRLKSLLPCLSTLLFVLAINAQSNLHIPKEIQKAYKKGTRSKDGKPGPNYWQNNVDYKIDVTVTPESRKVDGKETVVFTNNSPDVLASVVVRLYYDVFKTGNQRGMQVNENDIGDGVNIKKLVVNGVSYDLQDPNLTRRSGTNMEIVLPTPLQTGKQVTLEFEWDQKVPLTVRRTGAKDSSSFFIAYWYPQISVYDDIFGWDRIDYTFDTEFYNNLANFDVNITAPDNFLVWATGTLENSKDVLPDAILEKYNSAKASTDLVNVVDAEDLKTLKMKSTTWHYKANEVSDFAFAMSDHYLWDALSLEVSGKNVLIGTGFPVENAAQYAEVTKVQQKTMKHFTEDAPGFPFPYPEFTTFIGLHSGGMEFPMMANNQGPMLLVTIHEMFHTYFPMYVRVNERRFTWMEEGWAEFFTTLVMHKFFKDENDKSSMYSNFKFGMQGMIGTIGDLPTVTSSQYMSNNFGYHSYALPGFTYALLYEYLGEEKFLECLQTYIKRWAKKSPTPYDFFYTFEDVSGEDLNWLWDSWYFRMGYPDVGIKSFEDGKLTVNKIGARPVPVSVQIEYNSTAEKVKNQNIMASVGVWATGNQSHTIDIPNWEHVKSITINSDMPDFNELDNYFPTLADRYKKYTLNPNVLGEYQIQEFPVSAIISIEDGIYAMELTNAGISGFLIPVDDTNFVSTDGSMKLKFKEEDGEISGLELFLGAFGVTVNGVKK